MTTWVAFQPEFSDAERAACCATFKTAGVRAAELDDLRRSGTRILITRDRGPQTCQRIRQLAEGGINRVLVLVEPSGGVGDSAWRLLDAGAADVVEVDPMCARAGCLVAERIRRWRQIDEIVFSDEVRSELVGESAVWIGALRAAAEAALFSKAPILITGRPARARS